MNLLFLSSFCMFSFFYEPLSVRRRCCFYYEIVRSERCCGSLFTKRNNTNRETAFKCHFAIRFNFIFDIELAKALSCHLCPICHIFSIQVTPLKHLNDWWYIDSAIQFLDFFKIFISRWRILLKNNFVFQSNGRVSQFLKLFYIRDIEWIQKAQ